MAARSFLDFVPHDEKARLLEFFTSSASGSEGAAGGGAGPAVSIHTHLKDATGIPFGVQIFHASLGEGDERVHIVGIREEQDWHAVAVNLLQDDRLSAGARASSPPRLASSPSSASSSNDSGSDLAPAPDRGDVHVQFNVSAQGYPITSVSQGFQAIFGVNASPGEASLTTLVGECTVDVGFFEAWVRDEFMNLAVGKDRSSERVQVPFPVPDLQCLGVCMTASCSLSAPMDDIGILRLTLQDIRWKMNGCHSVLRLPGQHGSRSGRHAARLSASDTRSRRKGKPAVEQAEYSRNDVPELGVVLRGLRSRSASRGRPAGQGTPGLQPQPMQLGKSLTQTQL